MGISYLFTFSQCSETCFDKNLLYSAVCLHFGQLFVYLIFKIIVFSTFFQSLGLIDFLGLVEYLGFNVSRVLLKLYQILAYYILY